MNTADDLVLCHYSHPERDKLIDVETGKPARPIGQFIHRQFKNFILSPEFCCVGGKAAFKNNAYRFGVFKKMASEKTTSVLADSLRRFVVDQETMHSYATFVAVFLEPNVETELAFEDRLWSQLRELHLIDTKPWSTKVSKDPGDTNFAFSFDGHAFFIVSLHPNASRFSRRFSYNVLVFNRHAIFDTLREKGLYEGFQKVIRKKELDLQHTVNPSLANFGSVSEARQYSGRHVEEDWECPVQFA